MARQNRLDLIKRIEELRNCDVIVYFCGDRPFAQSVIADDATRYLYDHILSLDSTNRERPIALFLYSRGGRLEAPWKIVTMIRSYRNSFYVIVPYRAYSAATLLAMGADRIIMTRKAELGPIDPSLQLSGHGLEPPVKLVLNELGVEDVAGYIRFLRERVGLTDQEPLSRLVQVLAQELTPALLGNIERIYSHIRLVANKLLSLHRPPFDQQHIARVIEALTEKTYLHGHGIGRNEAREIGLDIDDADDELEQVCWDLYLQYESALGLLECGDPNVYFPDNDTDTVTRPNLVTACIESRNLLHAFGGNLELRRRRKYPPQPAINVNLGVQIPPVVSMQQLPDVVQQAINQILQNAAASIQQQVQKEIARQAPVEAIDVRLVGGRWNRADDL